MIKLRCLVVDDEPFARNGLYNFILRTPFLENAGAAGSTKEATLILNTEKIDLLFLDIEMPGRDGISFLKELNYKPNTIIITAHPQFAVESFELNVIDYLLKPVAYDRFVKAVNKVRSIQSSTDEKEGGYLFIKTGITYEKIMISTIDYIEAKGNYLDIHTEARSFMTYLSMKKMGKMLPHELFLKIHKSYIINVSKVTRLETNQVWLYNRPLPLSRSLKDEVTGRLIRHKKTE